VRSEMKLYRFLTASFCGLAVIYGFGLAYLWICTNLFLHIELSLGRTFWVGLVLLVPGAVPKAALAALLGVELRKRLLSTGML
jgi:biotin transporter BioY